MKRRILSIALALGLAASLAHAAEMNPNPLGLSPAKLAADPGPNVFELKLGSGTVGDFFGTGSGPTLTALYQRRVSESLSIGVQLARSSTRYSLFDGLSREYGNKYTHNTLSGRVAYHARDLIDDERVDLYGGGHLGYNTFSVSAFGPSVEEILGKTSYMVLGGFTGGRFWFHRSLGVNGEVGYNRALYYAYGYAGFAWASGSLGMSVRF